MRDAEKFSILKMVSKPSKKAVLIVVGIILGLILISKSTYMVNGGQYAIEQTPSGKLLAHLNPGLKFKSPFFSKVFIYNENTTIAYEKKPTRATSSNPPFSITFADTYSGKVTGSFRIVLPKDPEKFIELHKAFKNYDNFVDNGIEKFTNELLAYTANQFTGENFMQGGQNEYKIRLIDQANNGLYITKREAIHVKRRVGKVSLKKDNSGEIGTGDQIVYKTVVLTDDLGKKLREPNPMAKYGIKVSQVTIDGFIPGKQLSKFATNKKTRVQERAKLIENQENERQKAITAKLTGDRERIEAKQKMLKEKDAAVIEADKKVAMESKQAELEVVRKKKELQIAKANSGIQEANYNASKFQAKAKLELGLAMAKVKKANYNAINIKIFTMEVNRDIQLAKYKALPNVKLEMPKYLQIGNGSKNTPISDLANITVIDKLGTLK